MNLKEWQTIWIDMDDVKWKEMETQYYSKVKKDNIELERELEFFDFTELLNWSPDAFKEFLYEKYFVWKYTAPNRLATTRKKLNEISTPELIFILKALRIINDDILRMEEYDLNAIKVGFLLTTMIPGLGIAGASGLLSFLFPNYYGTVDQFVVKALDDAGIDTNVNYPENLSIADAINLERIMYEKAKALNEKNHTNYWTPRKVDKVLWTYRSNEL